MGCNTSSSLETKSVPIQYQQTTVNGETMVLFGGTWELFPSMKDDCLTIFAGMTPEEDAKDAANLKLIGRWSNIGSGTGFFVCEGTSQAVSSWAANWAGMAKLELFPICDDNVAREIILKKEPSWKASFPENYEPEEGESLFVIEYAFAADKKMDGFNAFASLTEEADKADAGKAKALGRWHNLGTGTGFAVCAAKSEFDCYKWAFNWAPICTCKITPTTTDKESRAILSAKPGFATKRKAVLKKLGMA